MRWSWQHDEWPSFRWNPASLTTLEDLFLVRSGIAQGSFMHLTDSDRDSFRVELISTEALKTSEIEGEILNRDSVQSSIRRQFGLQTDGRNIPPAARGIAELMVDVYRNYGSDLTDKTLFDWHRRVMTGRTDIEVVGSYRTGDDPMQVVSGAIYNPNIHFEAPPAPAMPLEMQQFITWFNDTRPTGSSPLPPLTRAGLTHLYFVLVHPFEDGNGRIARALSEMVLAQALGQPSLISLSHTIQDQRKSYYTYLERNNKGLEITEWLVFFAEIVLKAQEHSLSLLNFVIRKTKLYDHLQGRLNSRQEKVLERLFREGLSGFKGGLSARNYTTITQASTATATRDLSELVSLGALRREGEFRGTRYFLIL